MEQNFVVDMIQRLVWLMLLLSAPILVVSTVVGLAISILQAVTQIQESTITFVPKILAAMLVLVISAPWMLGTLVDYSNDLFTSLVEVARMGKS